MIKFFSRLLVILDGIDDLIDRLRLSKNFVEFPQILSRKTCERNFVHSLVISEFQKRKHVRQLEIIKEGMCVCCIAHHVIDL